MVSVRRERDVVGRRRGVGTGERDTARVLEEGLVVDGGVAKNRGSVRGDREVERVVGFSVEQIHGGELRRVWIRG